MDIYIFKLLEIFQYVLIAFVISFLISEFFNNYIFAYIIKNKNFIYFKLAFYLFLLSTVYYLLLKFIPKIPFVLEAIAKKFGYKTSFKNENIRGTQLGIGFIFFSQQNKFKELMNYVL